MHMYGLELAGNYCSLSNRVLERRRVSDKDTGIKNQTIGVRSSSFTGLYAHCAYCVQLYIANDSAHPMQAFCIFLSDLSLIYEGAVCQPK